MSQIYTLRRKPIITELPICYLLDVPVDIVGLSIFKTYSYLFSVDQFCHDILSIISIFDDIDLQLYCFYDSLKEIYTEMYGEVPKPDLEQSMSELSIMLRHVVRELDDVYQLNDKILPYDTLWIQSQNMLGLVNGSVLPQAVIDKLSREIQLRKPRV